MSYNRDRDNEESYGPGGRRHQDGGSSGYGQEREEEGYGDRRQGGGSSGYGRERDEESSYGRQNQSSFAAREREESEYGSGRGHQGSSSFGREVHEDSYGSSGRHHNGGSSHGHSDGNKRHQETSYGHRETDSSGIPFKSPFGSSDETDRSRSTLDTDTTPTERERSAGRGRNDSTTLGSTLSSQRLDAGAVDWQAAGQTLSQVAETSLRDFTKAVKKSGDIVEEEEARNQNEKGTGDSAFAKRLREEKSEAQVLREEGTKGLTEARKSWGQKMKEDDDKRTDDDAGILGKAKDALISHLTR